MGIIKDSSIWSNSRQSMPHGGKDPYLRIGKVLSTVFDQKLKEERYLVLFTDTTDEVPCNCRMMRKFGGVYNYEDSFARGYTMNDSASQDSDYLTKAGDVVLVAFIEGESRQGIILGGLMHPARGVKLNIEDGPQYMSEFNGVEKNINKDGEYTVTFKGQPTNLDGLKKVNTKHVEAPKYDEGVGTTYYKFDKTGSWVISDNAKSNPQSIKIDKPAGTVTMTAGPTIFKMSKGPDSIETTSKTVKMTAANSIDGITKDYKMDASSTAKIKSPKVAIGTAEVELLQHIAKLVDKLGTVEVISPVGLCTPLKATPQWGDVEEVKGKIKSITGSI